MRAEDCLVHIGYPKTATTWLQDHLFLPAHGFAQPIGRHELLARLVVPDQLGLDVASTRGWLADAIDGVADGLLPVISHERLAGKPYGDRLESAELARRIGECLPGARVLVVVREQRRMLLSQYLQYVRNGGTHPLEEFLTPQRAAEGFVPFFHWPYLESDRLVRRYVELVGPDRLLVLPYEALADDRGAFVLRICGWAGVPAPPTVPSSPRANTTWAGLTYRVKRPLNGLARRDPAAPLASGRYQLLMRASHRLDRALPSWLHRPPHRWAARVDAAVGQHYAESNRRLEALIGQDLRALGYA